MALGVKGVIPEVGQPQVPQKQSAVGMRIRADAAVSLRRQCPDFRQDAAVLIKQLLRMIGAQPAFEDFQMLLGLRHGDRHLMRQEVSLDALAVHFLRSRPALGRAQHDHGPYRARGIIVLPRVLLDLLNAFDHLIHGFGHQPVHGHGIIALDKIRLPAAAMEEIRDLLMAHTGKDGGIGNLVAVQMQDGQHSAVGDGIQELVALPGGGQGAGFRLSVAHRHRGNQPGIVEDRAKGVSDAVAQLAALIDGSGGFRRAVGRHSARERELLEQSGHAGLILGDIRIHFGIGAVQIIIGNEEVSAVAGAGQQDQVQIIALDGPVHVHEHKVLSRHGAPVADNLLLDHVDGQGTAQQRILQQVQLAGREIVGRAEPLIHAVQQLLGDFALLGAAGDIPFVHGMLLS